MGVVYLAYCGSWQLSLHVPCFCAFYIFNTTPNPTSSSFFQNVFVLVVHEYREGHIFCMWLEGTDCVVIQISTCSIYYISQSYMYRPTMQNRFYYSIFL